MIESSVDSPGPEPSGFESRDVQDIWIDGPGDTSIRPCPPELLPFLLAQREKIARWQNLAGSPGEAKEADPK